MPNHCFGCESVAYMPLIRPRYIFSQNMSKVFEIYYYSAFSIRRLINLRLFTPGIFLLCRTRDRGI